jgi:hypothetical protein
MDVGWPPLVAATVVTGLVAFAVSTPCGGGQRRTAERVVTLVPVLILAVALLQPTGEEVVESIAGRPLDSAWSEFWSPNPVLERAIDVNLARTDPSGAGEFLQGQAAASEPFRFVGYGGIEHPAAGWQPSYQDRRMDPNIQALLVSGRPMFLGLEEIQGYNPIQLRRYVELMTALNGRPQNYHHANLLPTGVRSPLIDLLNVRYVLIDATLPPDRDDVLALTSGRREVFRSPQAVVYENAAALPRAWIVHDVRTAERGAALPLLTTGGVDPRLTAIVEGRAALAPLPPGAAPDAVRVTRQEPDAMTIATSTVAPGLLVVSEVYESGWRALVDGAPVDVLPTNHAFRGVPIPAGNHTVELRYEPRSLRYGMALSSLATAVVLVALVRASWSHLRARRRSAAAVSATRDGARSTASPIAGTS